jgi:hypothetical protein
MDSVAKGPVPRCLDDLSVRPDARESLVAVRQGILGLRDQSYRGLEEVFSTYLVPGLLQRRAGRANHPIPRDQLVQSGNRMVADLPAHRPDLCDRPFANPGPVAVRRGTPRPIDSYWIIGHDQVELINLANPRQVTLLIATPAPRSWRAAAS